MIKTIIDRLTTDINQLANRLNECLVEDGLATETEIQEGIHFEDYLEEYRDGDTYYYYFNQCSVLKAQLYKITSQFSYSRNEKNIKEVQKYLSADYIKEMQEELATEGVWETREKFEEWLDQFHKDGKEQGYYNLNYRACGNYPIYRTVISAYYSDMLRVFHELDEYMNIMDITERILDIIKK